MEVKGKNKKIIVAKSDIVRYKIAIARPKVSIVTYKVANAWEK